MSIEANIQALTEAVEVLTGAIRAATAGVNTLTQASPGKEPTPSTSSTTEVKGAKTASKPASAPAQPGATPQSTEGTAAAPEATGITFKQLADVAVKLNVKDYAKLKAICDREKVAKISGLPESKWAEIHDEIVGLLGE